MSVALSMAARTKRRRKAEETTASSVPDAPPAAGPNRYLGTPDDLFAALHAEFRFTVDAASSHENALLPRHWTLAEDGLAQDWRGEVVYCNPMYDRNIKLWIRKALETPDCTAVFLLPVSTDTEWFALAWDHERHRPRPRCEVRFLRRRLKFKPASKPAAFGSVLVVVRRADAAPGG